MRHLINGLTGGDMWVADSRVEKYLAAGHRLAAKPDPVMPIMPEPVVKEEEETPKPVKKTARRAIRKR